MDAGTVSETHRLSTMAQGERLTHDAHMPEAATISVTPTMHR